MPGAHAPVPLSADPRHGGNMTKKADRYPLAPNRSALKDQASGVGLAIAMQAEAAAPEWVHLLPVGAEIIGRDGRYWKMSDPTAVIGASQSFLPLVIDYEHASEDWDIPADGGAPAAGWIEELELRENGIWGRVNWTPKGGERVANKEYRFLSPVFFFDGTTLEIIALCSVGLVHQPNLTLTALNNRGKTQEQSMKTVLAALGLTETATEAEALTAVNALKDDRQKALNAADMPSLEKFVPRAQHDEIVKALNTAQTKLADQEKAANETRVAELIDGAVKAGKIAPAAKDHFAAIALNNFDATKAAIDAMPAVVTEGVDPDLDKSDPAAVASNKTLTEQQKATCRQLGLSEEEYAKALA